MLMSKRMGTSRMGYIADGYIRHSAEVTKMFDIKRNQYEAIRNLMSRLAMAGLAVTALAITLIATLGAR